MCARNAQNARNIRAASSEEIRAQCAECAKCSGNVCCVFFVCLAPRRCQAAGAHTPLPNRGSAGHPISQRDMSAAAGHTPGGGGLPAAPLARRGPGLWPFLVPGLGSFFFSVWAFLVRGFFWCASFCMENPQFGIGIFILSWIFGKIMDSVKGRWSHRPPGWLGVAMDPPRHGGLVERSVTIVSKTPRLILDLFWFTLKMLMFQFLVGLLIFTWIKDPKFWMDIPLQSVFLFFVNAVYKGNGRSHGFCFFQVLLRAQPPQFGVVFVQGLCFQMDKLYVSKHFKFVGFLFPKEGIAPWENAYPNNQILRKTRI